MKKAAAKNNNQTCKKELVPIVGIGASAGGLKALKEFFSRVPEDSGLAFVVVVHLSPDHKSALVELLQPQVKMPVTQVSANQELKPNHVYVIPPGSNLNTIDTHLRLSDMEEKRSERAPIDHFFRTLAKTHDGSAIGIILTGTGSDGTLGMKEIKEKGGLTIVQDPTEAEYDGMPQSAIATGLMDLVLPLDEIADYLIKFIKTEPQIKLPEDEKDLDEEEARLVQRVFSQVKARTGRDFTRYKLSTLMRRMQRRMQIYQIEPLSEYLELLRKNPEEVRALSDDFLINVTNFFRDKHVFDYLEKTVIPNLFKNRKSESQIRIWSVGCATGEEAYSLAMLLHEVASEMEAPPDIQIFASDLHEVSLKRAREGYFPGDINVDINNERLKRFFTRQEGGFRIRKEIREMVIFTPHNLLSDPPFSRVDMIMCRNLLIYLKKKTQQNIFELMHYSLVPGGYLVLGASESLGTTELFKVRNKEFSVFTRKNVTSPEPKLPVFPSTKNHFPENIVTEKEELVSMGALHQKTVERFGPPSLLISPDYQILHVSETAGRYLSMPGGEPSNDAFKLIRKELALELRSVLHNAREKKTAIRSKPVAFTVEGAQREVILSARIIMENGQENAILVLFEEYDLPKKPVEKNKESANYGTLAKINEDLQDKLQDKDQQLQAIIEEYETSREEMKASNEELQSSNEELRSTLEELETNKEELQSLNEELTTLNQENRHKVAELSQVHDDLQNLLTATDIATLFINKEMRIQRYTTRLSELFNIRPEDRGRLISDITNKLGYENLKEDAEKVIRDLQPIEKQTSDGDKTIYLTRLRPYRSSEDKIDGVVITFIDITQQKEIEKTLEKQKVYAESIIETLHEPLLVLNPDLTIRSVNESFFNHFQVNDKDTIGRKIYSLGNGQWNIPELHKLLEDVLPDGKVFKDFEVEHDFENIGKKTMLLNARRLDHVQLILLGIRDITDRKQHEEELKKAKEAAEKAAKIKEEFLAHMSHEIRTPLNSIVGLSHLLLEQPHDKQQEKNLNYLNTASENLHELINDILDYSKLRSGKWKLKPEDIDIRECIENIVATHLPAATGKKIDLKTSVDKNIPNLVMTDETKLVHVINNLMSNAIKFTDEGEVKIDVKLNRRENNKLWLEFSVSDTGIGIKKKHLEEIFDEFSQADPSTIKQYKGTGLGLSIVKMYLQILDSDIHVESKHGKGSRFWFELPLKEALKKKAAKPEKIEEPLDVDFNNIRILVVEDDDFSRMMLSQLLTLWNIKHDEATNGEEGVEMAKKQDYDIIFMDIHMPVMDGFKATEILRETDKYKNKPIFALTADVTHRITKHVKSGLFTDKTIKPFDPDTLLADIKKIIGSN